MKRRWRGLVWGGLLCGALDLMAAITYHGFLGASPIRIMQSIAAGLLGRKAYAGGAATAALGTLLHFVIAFGAATAYYLASRRWRVLLERPIATGAAYGVLVYFFMNYVVLPLSQFPARSFSLQNFLAGIVIHIFCVGLPIALAVRKYAHS